MEHAGYSELLAAQAVDALDAAEARAVLAHVESCAECRRELAGLRDAAALLAHAAPLAAPDDDVRARILQAIRGLTESPKVLPLPSSSNGWPNVLRLAAAIAFVALLLGLIVLWRRDAASRRQITEVTRQLNRQQRELQTERENLAQQAAALALLTSADAKKIALAATTTAQNARATFAYDEKSRRGILVIEGLPPTPADKAYQVWVIPKGLAPIPGRTFIISNNGRAIVADNFPLEAGSSSVIAVTLEPKGGSGAPTGAIYLASPAG